MRTKLLQSLLPKVPQPNGLRPTSLARHIFVRVAFPVGIIFLSCFSLLDKLVQGQLRDHIKQELLAWDTQATRASVAGDARLSASLSKLAEAAGINQTLQRSAGAKGGAEKLLIEQLQKLSSTVDEDLLAVAGPDRQSIVTLRREGNTTTRASQNIVIPTKRQLLALDGQYYFVSSHQVAKDGKAAGWIVTGRHWLREMPLGEGLYVLAKNGKVLQTAGVEKLGGLEPGSQFAGCAGEGSMCEAAIDHRQQVFLRSASTRTGEDLAIYVLRSVDVMASPLLGMTRSIMLAGALLSILGALGLAVLTGRAISLPLQNITDSCVRAQDTGHLLQIQVPPSRIAEVNALGMTLQAAVRSAEEGQTKLSQAYFQFMGAIVALLDARDNYTAGHSHRVSAYSEALARDFGLPQQQVEDIRVGALLHDIGKIGVPDEILRKHERLTPAEFELMKQHPTIGRNVLEQVVQFDKYLDAVELHHENLDGTGYPRGLRGEQIPIAARIVKVADVYDALSTDRPYRARMSQEKVHQILRDGAGTHFDRLLVEIFLSRSVPSFEQRSSLEQLFQAIGDSQVSPSSRKAVGA